MKLRLKCKEATALMLAREDRPLPLWQELSLRAHIAACRACPVVERQILLMRRAFARWREDAAAPAGDIPPGEPQAPTGRPGA